MHQWNGNTTSPMKNKFKTMQCVGKVVVEGIFRTYKALPLSSWIKGQQWMQTATAQHCGTWRKLSEGNTMACSQRKLSFSMMMPIPIQPVSKQLLEQFLCETLTHPPYSPNLHLKTPTSSHHWRSISEENTSNREMRWKPRCANGCKHQTLISSL